MGFLVFGEECMMTPKTWNDLVDKLTKEPSFKQKENIIVDAFMDGLIDVNVYKMLIQQICAPIKSTVMNAEDFRGFPTLKSSCDCGAKHTSFPNHHYNWCGAKKR
jgi:hypothetical protein